MQRSLQHHYQRGIAVFVPLCSYVFTAFQAFHEELKIPVNSAKLEMIILNEVHTTKDRTYHHIQFYFSGCSFPYNIPLTSFALVLE